MIFAHAESAVTRYNESGLHYNLVAEGIYRARASIEAFSEEYERFIIAGLLSFDVGRMMGQGDKDAADGRGFRQRVSGTPPCESQKEHPTGGTQRRSMLTACGTLRMRFAHTASRSSCALNPLRP